VQDDDEILDAYESELGATTSPNRRPGRGFLIVTVAILLGGILLVVEIFSNRPLVSSIGHAQNDLRAARALALGVESQSGTFDGADASGLGAADHTRRYLGSDQPSLGVGQVSVFASGISWAAAVAVRPGACFYIFEEVGRPTRYGGGDVCTGRAALAANADAW